MKEGVVEKVLKMQPGGNIRLTGANEPVPQELPLSVRLGQKEEGTNKASPKQGAGIDFSDFDKLKEANDSDKMLMYREIQDIQGAIQQNTYRFGEKWLRTNEAKKLQNRLGLIMANAPNALKNGYDYIEQLNSDAQKNDSWDAYVTPSLGTVLVEDREGRIKGVKFSDYERNRNIYKAITNQEWLRMRRTDPTIASIDMENNNIFSNAIRNVRYGGALTKAMTEYFKNVGEDKHLERLASMAGELTGEEVEAIKRDGHSSNKYLKESDRAKLMEIAALIMGGDSFIDESTSNGIYQKAAREVMLKGVPQDKTFDKAVAEQISAMLLGYAKTVSSTKITPYTDPKDVARAGRSQTGSISARPTLVAATGRGEEGRIKIGEVGYATTQMVLPKDITLSDEMITNIVPTPELMKSTTGKVFERREALDILNTTVPTKLEFFFGPVDREGRPMTGFIEGKSRQAIRDNGKLNLLMGAVSAEVARYIEEGGMDYPSATERAVKEFYEKVANTQGIYNKLGISKGNVDEARRVIQEDFRLGPIIHVEGMTNERHYSTGKERQKEGSLNHYNSAMARAYGGSMRDAPKAKKVWDIELLIPVATNSTPYQPLNQKLGQYHNVENKTTETHNIFGMLEGGKLISFNDFN